MHVRTERFPFPKSESSPQARFVPGSHLLAPSPQCLWAVARPHMQRCAVREQRHAQHHLHVSRAGPRRRRLGVGGGAQAREVRQVRSSRHREHPPAWPASAECQVDAVSARGVAIIHLRRYGLRCIPALADGSHPTEDAPCHCPRMFTRIHAPPSQSPGYGSVLNEPCDVCLLYFVTLYSTDALLEDIITGTS